MKINRIIKTIFMTDFAQGLLIAIKKFFSTKKKCIWENSYFGSYCKDPKTATRQNIKKERLNENIVLAIMSRSSLSSNLSSLASHI